MNRFLILLALIFVPSVIYADHIGVEGIPKISLAELNSLVQRTSPAALQSLKDEGGKISAFVINGLGAKYEQAIKDLIENGPECMNRLPENERNKLQMTDQSNRMTYATMDGDFPDCFGIQYLSDVFDEIDGSISSLVPIVRKEVHNLVDGTMMYKSGRDHVSLDKAMKKEHIHVYDRSVSTSSYIVPFHIDNGLFLILTPFPGHGLRVKTSNNKVVSLDDLELDSAIVLFGRGVTEWLLQDDDETKQVFYAAPHAVPSGAIDGSNHRTVYARMAVVEASATPLSLQKQDGTSKFKTFGDVFMETGETNFPASSHNNLCPMTDSLREGDEWISTMKNQCDEGFAFCWMNCLPLPAECPHEEEAVCHNATNEPCFDDSMDVSCHWDCK